jgi:predicted nucleic acid-binding protein
MVYDSDVLIWLLRGNRTADRALYRDVAPAISVVAFMELLAGARSRQEARSTKAFLAAMRFTVLPLSENIGHRAAIYVEEYGLGSGLDVPDALIAATATEHGLTLCTGNYRHYRAIADLDLRPFRA